MPAMSMARRLTSFYGRGISGGSKMVLPPRGNRGALSIYDHAYFVIPGEPKYRDADGKLRSALSPSERKIRPALFVFSDGSMLKILHRSWKIINDVNDF